MRNTIDVNLKDDQSDISDFGHKSCRSKSGFRRDCCLQKDKIMTKLTTKNKRKASKIRETSVIGGGGGPRESSLINSHRSGGIDPQNPLMQSQLTNFTNLTSVTNNSKPLKSK